jgi:hypothetical protein
LNAKFSNIGIEHQLFACDQRNVQETSVFLFSFSRNALNKDMAFEQGEPNRRKIISPAYQLCAPAREIAGFLLRHSTPSLEIDAVNA